MGSTSVGTGSLQTVAIRIREVVAESSEQARVPGYLAGVYQDGHQAVVAHGVTNVVTKNQMLDDTGFLAGSICKVMTATLVMEQVERGRIDLDERVITYLPEFKLAPPSGVEEIRVRNLLNHTNGIDADLFFVDAKGRDALKTILQQMARQCGSLFRAGELVSYSNGGMIVAGRVLEVVTGESYHDLLRREIYEAAGMANSVDSPAEAILRSTAVGHFANPATGEVQRTDMFMLPEAWAPAGGTQVVTINDLLAFARVHLSGGMAASGKRLLSRESTQLMQEVTAELGTPNSQPIGLGWPLLRWGQVAVPFHSGASPGGVAVLALVPQHDLAFVAYGNSGGALALHDKLMVWILSDYLGIKNPEVITEREDVADLHRYEGTYRSDQMRVDISVKDGQLEEQMTYEPVDPGQARIFNGFSGGFYPFPPRRLAPIKKGLFGPAGMPLEAFTSIAGRLALVSFHGDVAGRPTHRCMGGRLSRRTDLGV